MAASITFWIKDSVTNEPIADATIACGGGMGTMTTGADGSARFDSPPMGVVCSVAVSASGYESVSTDFFDDGTGHLDRPISLTPAVVPPEPAEPGDFIIDKEAVYYAPGGASSALNDYAAETGKLWKLTVNFRVVNSFDGPYDTEPADRAYSDIIDGWIAGEEVEKFFHLRLGKWFWVTYPCTLEELFEPPLPTVDDFKEDLDLVYYAPGGALEHLNTHAADTGKNWKMTVNKRSVVLYYGPYDAPLSPRTYSEFLVDIGNALFFIDLVWEPTGKHYRVAYPIILEEIPELPANKLFGYVLDAETTDPIQGATVTWGAKSIMTNAAGYYEIIDPDVASGDFVCTADGYDTNTQFLTYDSGLLGPMNFHMVLTGVVPPYVVASA